MTGCVFCKIIAGELPAVKVYEDGQVLAFMDIYPLRRGHVLVVPRQHHQHLHQLAPQTRAQLFDTGSRIAQALYASVIAPAAVHYMVNDGPAAHQTVPHVHLHVLPRHHGDRLNFLARLLRKPLDLMLGPDNTDALERDAADIRRHLA